MDSPLTLDSPQLFWLGLLSTLGIPLGFWYYGRLTMRLRRDGGEVSTGALGMPDLIASAMLATFLAVIALAAFHQSSQGELVMNRDVVLAGGGFQVGLAAIVAIFLAVRRVRMRDVVHPGQLSLAGVVWQSVIMLLCAIPVVLAFGVVTYLLPKDMRAEQEMVKLFQDVSSSGNFEMIILISLTAVIVAPICEEFIFRGYFYPIWKRYFGAAGSAVLASTLFALMHANLASLPALFALAMCFTLAFEATGSLAVPVIMHALFNGLNLAMLYLRAHGMVTL